MSENRTHSKSVPGPRGIHLAAIPNLDSAKLQSLSRDITEIKNKLNKPDGFTKQATAFLKATAKSIEIGAKLAGTIKTGNKMSLIILNNVTGLTLELVTQSCELFAECSGTFVSAPDPFIMPGLASTLTSSKRDNSVAGNINGVIYKASFLEGGQPAFQITVAWDNPLSGKSHYHLEVKPWSEEIDKNFLKKAVDTRKTGVIRYPDDEHPLPGCPFETVAVFSSEEISVLIQPLA